MWQKEHLLIDLNFLLRILADRMQSSTDISAAGKKIYGWLAEAVDNINSNGLRDYPKKAGATYGHDPKVAT